MDYLRDVKPILAKRCYACHGPFQQKSGLRLGTGEVIRRGGESGPAVVATKPESRSLRPQGFHHATAELVVTTLSNHAWEVIVSPDEDLRLIVVVTAYPC